MGVPTLPVSLLVASVAVMLVFLSLGLLHLVFAMPSQEKELVNEMVDLVESGLDQSEARMGRVVMVSVTLSLTTENTETATVTTTLVNSCVAGTFTGCYCNKIQRKHCGYLNDFAIQGGTSRPI